jgi:cyclophilin family peptidyl-prolyl cis-trans isomerase
VLVLLQNGNAVITGDNSANQLEITGGLNSILVRGLEGTTINGGTATFTLASTTTFNGSLLISLGQGNDRLSIGADVSLAGVNILGEAGDDTISLASSTVAGNLVIDAADGNNTITLLNSQLLSGVALGSSGPALISLRGGRVAGKLNVDTASGDDQVSVDATTINGNASFRLRTGNDVIAIRNATLNGELYVDAGRGDDVVYVEASTVARRSAIWMREGNDNLRIQGNTRFNRRLLVGAVLGSDRVEITPSVVLPQLTRLGRPGAVVDPAVIDAKVNNTSTGAFGRAATAVDLLTPVLSVDVTPSAIGEEAGASAATASISRSGSTRTDLTVTLTSSVTTRATVPATVTIPAGSQSASVAVAAVDNSTAEPDATVTITASAAGLKTGSDTLTVTGQETAALTLTPPSTSIAEAAAESARTFSVARNTTDNSQPLTVTLTSSNPARAAIPASITIPAGDASASFVAIVQNTQDDGDAFVQITASATTLISATSTVTIVDDDTTSGTLAITAPATSVNENSASGLLLTITRNGLPLTAPLTVNLLASNPRLTVPTSVTIPADAASATVSAVPVNDSFDDNDLLVQITASADTFSSGILSVTVVEDDIAALALSPATSTVLENAGAADRTFTVTRNAARNTSDLTVNLSTGSQTRLTAPATVVIPAEQNSADFIITANDNQLFDSTISVQLTAGADGFTSAQSTISLVDDESPVLTLAPATAGLSENSTADGTLTISRNTADLSSPLIVQLASDSSRVTVPTQVTIPINQSSATFTASAVQNDLLDGTSSVVITASSTSFTSATSTLSVSDDDVPALAITPTTATVAETVGSTTVVVSLGKVTTTDRVVTLNYSSPLLISGPASVTIPAGQSAANLQLTIAGDVVVNSSLAASVTASIAGSNPATSTITVLDNDTMPLTASGDSNPVVDSSNTLITKNSSFTITGESEPFALIELDADGNGTFESSTSADTFGDYSISTTLTHTPQNKGANRLVLRTTSGPNAADTALNVHYALGTVIRFDTTSGTFDAELLDSAAPVTVANFQSYQESSAWQNLIVHRNVPNFVIQAGGFTVSNSQISAVPTNPPINNEFNPANSNVRGTIAMAMVSGNINSGSSQWFINVVDNTFLDDGKYTVFGRIIGSGMQVVDAINNIPSRNVSTLYNNGVLGEVPLDNTPPAGTQLSGTVTTQAGNNLVLGTGTAFTTQLQPGQSLRIGGRLHFVSSIQSDTQLTLTTPAPASNTSVSAFKDAAPPDADFVVFSNISELLLGG